MRNLFWRIFAAVWLANVAIVVALALITTLRFEAEKIPGLELTRLQSVMDQQLRRIEREGRRGGPERLDAALRIAASMGPVQYYALDSNDTDRLGRLPTLAVRDAAAATRAGAPIASERMRTALATLRGENTELVLVASTEGSLFSRVLFKQPSGFWMQIIVAMIVSALVSALLAWSVAAPLARIRMSTRRFAEGDLDTRVGTLRFGGSDEIKALASEFDRMAERIAALIDNNRRLVRDVSHELRSPLARLRVALELARGQDGAAVEQSLDRIERESDRLEAMLSQAIELSRLETRPERSPEAIALDELVEDVIANADYEATPLGRKVVLSSSTPITMVGARDTLYGAIENIVRNALAYTADGTRVEVCLARDSVQPGNAVLSIRDHGPGVAEADLTRIFEPFFRTDAARARSSGGTGLGLAIARRAIANHGGSIQAQNAPDGGLDVVIRLPASPPIDSGRRT